MAVSHSDDDDDSELLKQDDVANVFVHMYEINTEVNYSQRRLCVCVGGEIMT